MAKEDKAEAEKPTAPKTDRSHLYVTPRAGGRYVRDKNGITKRVHKIKSAPETTPKDEA